VEQEVPNKVKGEDTAQLDQAALPSPYAKPTRARGPFTQLCSQGNIVAPRDRAWAS